MKRLFRLLVLAALVPVVAACDDESATGPGAESSTVAVRAYVDANGTGTFDAGDVPLSGATVTLTSAATTLTATTGSHGLASFEDVPSGSYRATLSGDVPAGAQLAGASSPIVVAPAFGDELEAEFRYVFLPGQISGALFRDENGNGVFDAGVDTPAPGIPVALFRAGETDGEPVAETTTDATGVYTFDTLRPGSYTVVFSPFPTMELVGGASQDFTVSAGAPTAANVTFTGNLLSPVADARAAALAGEAQVVAVKGVATWQPSFSDELFIQDGTAGIQVFLGSGGRNLGIATGDTVIIVGETNLRFGEAQIRNVSATIETGTGPAPDAVLTTAEEVNTGDLGHQLVSIEGATVTDVDTLSFGNQFVTLTDAAGNAFGVYADSRTGVTASTWTVGGLYDVMGVVGFDSRFAFPHRIEVRGPADVQAGEAPLTIAEAKAAAAGTVVTVAGVVTWQPTRPDGSSFSDELFIQDATGGIQIYARDSGVRTLGLAPGDVVLVTGTTQDRFGERQITNTTAVLKIATQAPPAPVVVTPAQIASGDFVHRLVRVEDATVVSVDSTTLSFGNQLVTLRAPNGEEFGVYVDSRTGVVAADWTVGSMVDVTGVINFDSRYAPHPYRIWVRSPADIVPAS